MTAARVLSEENVARAGGQTTELAASLVVNDSSAPGVTVADALTSLSGGGVAPFSNFVLVDPLNAAAYPTLQDAVDAKAALALTSVVVIFVRPGVVLTENVALPAGCWEFRSASSGWRRFDAAGLPRVSGSRLVGNINWTAGAASGLCISDFEVTGNITAVVGSGGADGATLHLIRTNLFGNIDATGGAGFLNVYAQGEERLGSVQQFRIVGAISANFGTITFESIDFSAGLVKGFSPVFRGCSFSGASSVEAQNNLVRFLDGCAFGLNLPITTTAGGVVTFDSQSYAQLRAATAAAAPALTNCTMSVLDGASEFDNGNSGAAKTIDFTLGSFQLVTLNAAAPALTLRPPGSVARLLELRIVQDAVGGRVPTWATTAGALKWSGGVPALTAAANAIDIVELVFTGSLWFGKVKGLNYA